MSESNSQHWTVEFYLEESGMGGDLLDSFRYQSAPFLPATGERINLYTGSLSKDLYEVTDRRIMYWEGGNKVLLEIRPVPLGE